MGELVKMDPAEPKQAIGTWSRARSIGKAIRAAVAPVALALGAQALEWGAAYVLTPGGQETLARYLGNAPQAILGAAIVTALARYFDDKRKHAG